MKLFSSLHSSLNRFLHRSRAVSSSAQRDSVPVIFGNIRAEDIAGMRSKQIEDARVLRWLDMDMVRRMHEDIVDGYWAEPQWVWEQLEQVDSHMIIAIRNRKASLAEYKITVQPLEDLDDAEGMLADAQVSTIRDLLAGIVNLDEAIDELSVASRRHYTLLQPIIDGQNLRLESIPRWLVARDGYSGQWQWNPTAARGSKGQRDWPMPFEHLIMRVCPSPLDLPATSLALNRSTTYAQWDCFLENCGVPPMFLVGPEGISEAEHKLYLKAAKVCMSAAKGFMPHGTSLLSPAVPAINVELFSRRIQLADDGIIMLYTGSTLTTTTAPDSGTLAGNAHADTASKIAAAEAADIAAVFTRGLLLPTLAQYHPGQAALCRIVMRKDASPSVAENIQNLGALRVAGYSADVEQASSRTGWKLSEAPVAALPQSLPMGTLPSSHRGKQLLAAMHRNRSRIHYAPARSQYELSMHSAIMRAEAESPLSADELALAQKMASASLEPMQLAWDVKYLKTALDGAVNSELSVGS